MPRSFNKGARRLQSRYFVPSKHAKSHFVRISFALGAKVPGTRRAIPTHNVGIQRNEKASLRGRVRARDDRLVVEWFSGACDGSRRRLWHTISLDQYLAHQERAQTHPGAGALL